jgi:DNA-binding XRE family transcriptional regulator
MHNIESYSRYLHQLVKEGKYENVLINFRDNCNNFNKEEIANNSYLIGDLLRCHREQNDGLGGIEFLKIYEVDVFKLNDNYAINHLGWLLHYILKTADENTKVLDDVVIQSIDFVSKISFLDEKNELLITQLLIKIIGYEKKRKPITVDNLLILLKGINIKHDKVKAVIASDGYIVSGIMDVLRKGGHVERAFGFIKFLGISVDANTPEQILNSFGWYLYSRLKSEINDEEEDDSDAQFDSLLVDLEDSIGNNNQQVVDLHPTNETINLISNCIGLFSLDSTYSPFSKLFNLSLKAEKRKSNPNWAWMESFLIPFKSKSLSLNCDTIDFVKGGKIKTVELASDLETWYAYYSLSLLKQKKFQECIDISKQALFSIEKFHYSNDLWFARRIALSNKGLGNIPQAINEMESIERRKGEWFIQKELAELYFESGDLEKAKNFACKCALSYGEKEKKDGLYFLLGQIFKHNGNTVLAFKHFLLVNLIREEQGWFIPNSLKIALEEIYVEGVIQYDNSVLLYKELLNTWRENSENGNDKFQKGTGKIIKVNGHKQIGSIQGKNGVCYFFHFNDFKDQKHMIKEGVQVYFMVKPPKDDRPGKDHVAYNIKLKK